MNDAFHTDPSSSSTGDVGTGTPNFWGTHLAFRIWLWLSQICAFQLYARPAPLAEQLLRSTKLRGAYTPFQMARQAATEINETPPLEPRHEPRHERRVAARRARGIRPVGRYTRYSICYYLAAGMSAKRSLGYARRLSPLLAVKDFVRFCPRFLSLVHDSGLAQKDRHCGAPLSPD